MNYSTKKELAMAYCPDIDYTAALKKLNQWIRNNTELSAGQDGFQVFHSPPLRGGWVGLFPSFLLYK